MGTIHEINHPYHPFGGPFMEPPISFFCGASILRSRLWVIKKNRPVEVAAAETQDINLKSFTEIQEKQPKTSLPKQFLPRKNPNINPINQWIHSVSFQKKATNFWSSQLLLPFSGRVKAAPLDVLTRGSGESEELLPLVAILRRWSSHWGFPREFGCFFSLDVLNQWMFFNGNLGFSREFWIWIVFFNESEKPFISYIGIIMDVPRKSQNFPNDVNSWEFWAYHWCFTEIPVPFQDFQWLPREFEGNWWWFTGI